MDFDLPQVFRTKRRRNEDPLYALILEDTRTNKRSKGPRSVKKKEFFYELRRTDEISYKEDGSISKSLLSEAPGPSSGAKFELGSDSNDDRSTRKRRFNVPRSETEDDLAVSGELSDMLNDYLSVSDFSQSNERKKRLRTTDDSAASDFNAGPSDEKVKDSDYVYDVYYLTSNGKIPESESEKQLVGYINFSSDSDFWQTNTDDESSVQCSDDEDSNTESFYKNDYPSDEDANSIGIQSYQEYSEPYVMVDQSRLEDDNFQDLYDRFNDEALGGDILDVIDQEEDNLSTLSRSYERNIFFPGEEDDEMAKYRDKIFGKLQREIHNSEL